MLLMLWEQFIVMKTTVTPDIVEILRSGAEKSLYWVEDWAAHFDHNPADQPFVQQLRAEWQPVVAPDHFCHEMMIFTRNHVLSYVRGGPHLWAHILRVTGA